jgi:hypothetical protein
MAVSNDEIQTRLDRLDALVAELSSEVEALVSDRIRREGEALLPDWGPPLVPVLPRRQS